MKVPLQRRAKQSLKKHIHTPPLSNQHPPHQPPFPLKVFHPHPHPPDHRYPQTPMHTAQLSIEKKLATPTNTNPIPPHIPPPVYNKSHHRKPKRRARVSQSHCSLHPRTTYPFPSRSADLLQFFGVRRALFHFYNVVLQVTSSDVRIE